jgi:hypothetical protein
VVARGPFGEIPEPILELQIHRGLGPAKKSKKSG